MFNEKSFIKELDRFELINKHDIDNEEIHAIIRHCETEEDPVYLAVFLGFQCGCMKAGVNNE